MYRKVFWISILYWGILLVIVCCGVGLIVLSWAPLPAVRVISPQANNAFWHMLGWTAKEIIFWRWPLLWVNAMLFCFWGSLPYCYERRLHGRLLRGVYRTCQQHPVVILIGFLLIGNVVIFVDFLFGNKRLFYIDLGSDSVSQVMPFTYYFTHAYHFNKLWIHESALGNTIFTFPMTYNIFDPLLHLVFFRASIDGIADRMVYYVILQSLIAGICFYKFLCCSNRTPTAAIIGALSYSFCGAFSAVATWWGSVWVIPLLSATACVLWAVKVWQQDRRWIVLLVAFAYFIVTTQVIVTLYQLMIFLALYVSFDWLLSIRVITPANLRELMRRLAQIAGIGGLAVLCLGMVTIPHGYYMLFENYRYKSAFTSFLQYAPLKELFATFLRLFSNDLLGTANTSTVNYQYSNYMELPFLYSGLLVLLVIPAFFGIRGFRAGTRKEFFAINLFLVPICLSLISPGIRAYLFYGGKLTYFRWMCAFTTATFVIVGAYALDGVLASARISRARISVALASGFWLAGLGVCYLYILFTNRHMGDNVVFCFVGGVLLGYPLVLSLPNPRARQACLVIVTLLELIWQGHYTMTDDRIMLRKAESYSPQHTNVYSYPPMVAALNLIKNDEHELFFRVSKTPEYIAIDYENSALCQLYYGTRGYTSFNNKYTIAFFLNRQIPLEWPKDAVELPGFQNRHVLDNLVGVKYYLKREYLPVPSWAQPVTTLTNVNIFVNPQAFPLGVLYDGYLWQDEMDALPLAEEIKDNVFMLAAVLPAKASVRTALTMFEIPHFDQPLSKITNTSEVLQAIRDKQAHGVELLTFGNDVITGKFTAPRASILFFSIPYDPGWHIYLDDQEIEKFPLNIGFLGAIVPGGHHTVKLVFLPRVYQIGKVISMCALVFVGLSLTVFRTSSRRWFCSVSDSTSVVS